jgi:hypothetical protein
VTPAPGFRLGDEERLERYRLLQEATALREPPVITEAGLHLLLESAARAQRTEELDEPLLPELDQLVRVGLIGGDGLLNPDAKHIVETLQRPHIQLTIEVAAGKSMRAFKAWLGYRHAVILAQPSPAIMAANSPQDVADREPPTLPGYGLDAVMPGWVPVAAARWLGFGPRESLAGHFHLPISLLLQRIADPDVQAPGGDAVLARLWDEPMQLCAISVQPGDERLLLLDAARTGMWLVSVDETSGADAEAELRPVPSHTVWRLLLTLITVGDIARRKEPI